MSEYLDYDGLSHFKSKLNKSILANVSNLQIVVGDYVGDGKNTKSLTFPAKPLVVFIWTDGSKSNGSNPAGAFSIFSTKNLKATCISGGTDPSRVPLNAMNLTVSMPNEKTMQWTTSNLYTSSKHLMNDSSQPYNYIAFCEG